MLLLDSHVVLWWVAGPEEMSREARTAIEQENQPILVSVATFWELEIKAASEKLRLPSDLWSTVERAATDILAIDREDALSAARLPLHHRDPFDRLIIAQARRRGLRVVTRDAAFSAYDVSLIRA